MAIEERKDQTMKEKKPGQADQAIKYQIRPTRYVNYDCAENKWDIEVHLPGVNKENISIKFLNNAYVLEARRDQALYKISEYLPFEVDTNSVKGEYSNGLLYLNGNIKNPLDEAIEIKL